MYKLSLRILKTVCLAGLLHVSAATADVIPAPQIHLSASDGEIDLAGLKGKVVYLDFWASWCTPCQKSFPWMQRMKSIYEKQGFEVVAVNLDSDRKLADQFLKSQDVNFVIAFDAEGRSAKQYQLQGMPSSFLIGRDGKIYGTHIGFRDVDKSTLEGAIRKLLMY